MASNNNNVYNDQQRTLLNPSHLKRADVDNGTGKIIWARDIDWGDISSSFNLVRIPFSLQVKGVPTEYSLST